MKDITAYDELISLLQKGNYSDLVQTYRCLAEDYEKEDAIWEVFLKHFKSSSSISSEATSEATSTTNDLSYLEQYERTLAKLSEDSQLNPEPRILHEKINNSTNVTQLNPELAKDIKKYNIPNAFWNILGIILLLSFAYVIKKDLDKDAELNDPIVQYVRFNKEKVRSILSCQLNGWVVSGGLCIPKEDEKGKMWGFYYYSSSKERN